MKKVLIAFLPWLFAAFSYKAMAQEDAMNPAEKDKKEAQEIIIRKKGDKDVNLTIKITGDKVLINGKPLIEFKDDEITVNKRKMIVRDGNQLFFGEDLGDLGNGSFSWSGDDDFKKTFLGVSTDKHEEGALITEITKESGAEKAGLQKDDIITKINDKKIDGPGMLAEIIGSMKPKDEVKVYFKRNGKEKNVKAILQERKENGPRSFSFTSPDGSYKTFSMPRIPAVPRVRSWNGDNNFSISPDMESAYNDYSFAFDGFPRKQKLGLKIQDTEEGNGVKVLLVEDSSAAAIAGLKKDDVIVEIGGEKVTNTDEAREQLQENREKSTYVIKARRNNTEMKFDIKIPKKLKTANL